VYAVLQCGQCHGPQGRGDGPSADELTDDWDQPIRAYDFTRGYYKNGSTPADLYRTLVTGLSGTPMPALDRDNLTFPGGPDVDIAPMREGLDPESSRRLEAYVASQPPATDLEIMPGAEVEKLVQHRLWTLVYYLRSLSRPSGLFHWLFGENPELQVRAGAQ
jgi:mono/diheme cytochrome c family protein